MLRKSLECLLMTTSRINPKERRRLQEKLKELKVRKSLQTQKKMFILQRKINTTTLGTRMMLSLKLHPQRLMLASKLVVAMMKEELMPNAVVEVVIEGVAEEAMPKSNRAAKDRTPDRLLKRPKKTSQPYEHDDLTFKIVKRVG